MGWTRSLGARMVAVVAAAALVVVHWHDRGPWFWVGLAALLLNALGLLARRSFASAPTPEEGGPVGQRATAASGPGGTGPAEAVEMLLGQLDLPEVVAEFEAGPDEWRQVSYLEDDRFDPVPWRFIADHVWIEFDEDWSIGMDDEVKPFLDLDRDPEDDPILTVLRSHPAIADAWHEDREVYRTERRATITVGDFAELAARALVAHHVHARSGAA